MYGWPCLRQKFIKSLLLERSETPLQTSLEAVLVPDGMSIGISSILQVTVAAVVSGNLDCIPCIHRLAIERTIRHLDAAVAIKIALVDGVIAQCAIDRV